MNNRRGSFSNIGDYVREYIEYRRQNNEDGPLDLNDPRMMNEYEGRKRRGRVNDEINDMKNYWDYSEFGDSRRIPYIERENYINQMNEYQRQLNSKKKNFLTLI
jgi:hypothetical protein